MTKQQRRNKAARSSKKRRIANAITGLLKAVRPGSVKRVTEVQMRKNPGGSITIIPVKSNPALEWKRYDIEVQAGKGRWVGVTTVLAKTARAAVAKVRRDIHPARGEKLRAKLR